MRRVATRGVLGAATTVAVLLGVLGTVPASAAPAHPGRQARHAGPGVSAWAAHPGAELQRGRHTAARRAPRPSARTAARTDYDRPAAAPVPHRPSAGRHAHADCDVSRFTGNTGRALVAAITGSATACVNTLFGLTGSDAYHAFRQAQMVTVAYALRDNATSYPGDDSTGTTQLVLYLRAGYYVQYYDPADVGGYGPALTTAVRSGLDSFFGTAHAFDVTDANGETLSEAVTLIDSAGQNARYLWVVKRLLSDYDGSYDGSYWMLAAVNNTFTVLYRGHWLDDFIAAVAADPSVLDVLHRFTADHLDLAGTDRSYLVSNAARELTRFLDTAALRGTVRPLAADLLSRTSMTGPTAPVWVGVADMADYYDGGNCSYYGICGFRGRLADAVLPTAYHCNDVITIRAQRMTDGQLSDACTSLTGETDYFHRLVHDDGPVADDHNDTIQVVVFDSSTDYQTYSGVLFGNDTNNGGIYLEGDPSDPDNQARFLAYRAEWEPSFQIWNLNHEFTHYLDGRYDMYGDFVAGTATPTIWWIEGLAEYVSYSYRGLTYTDAITQAGAGTYRLSTLFDTTYDNADQTRVYNWGYLAVRYMLERHGGDITSMLGYFRTGDYTAARALIADTIGGSYDADWDGWLADCAAGACAAG